MNKKFTALAMAALLVHMDASAFIHAMEISAETYASANESHQWKGKKVAFLGDSITDKQRIGTQKCYWEYLAEMLGIDVADLMQIAIDGMTEVAPETGIWPAE